MGIFTGLLAKAGFDTFQRGTAEAVGRVTEPHPSAQVIPLHADAASAAGTSFGASASAPQVRASAPGPAGMPAQDVYALQDDPKLVEFRERDHFSAGYRDALDSPDHEALEQGCGRLLAGFDNLTDQMISVLRARIGQADLYLLDAGQQVSPLAEAKLRKFIEHVQRDIDELQQQRELAQSGKGWYRAALADYRAGFLRGMNEAIHVRRLMR